MTAAAGAAAAPTPETTKYPGDRAEIIRLKNADSLTLVVSKFTPQQDDYLEEPITTATTTTTASSRTTTTTTTPPASPPGNGRGGILLLHGVCSHSRFCYFNHSQHTKHFNEKWKQMKREMLKDDTQSEEFVEETDSSGQIREVTLNPPDCPQNRRVKESVTFFQNKLTDIDKKVVAELTDGTTTTTHQGEFEGGWVDQLCKAGWTVYALDQQGHGYSEGWQKGRCNVEMFDNYTRDALQVFEEVIRKDFPDNFPTFVMGISMGGLVTARFLELGLPTKVFERVAPPTGVVMLAPALRLRSLEERWQNRMLLPFAKTISKVTPFAKVAKKATNEHYCYIENLVNLDPMTYKFDKVPARIAHEFIVHVKKAQDEIALADTRVSVLICHSKNDSMCDPQGSEQLFGNFGGPDKQLWRLDDMWHYLTSEPGWDILLGKVIAWVDGRAAAKSPS